MIARWGLGARPAMVVVDLFACLPDLLDDCEGRVSLDNSFDLSVDLAEEFFVPSCAASEIHFWSGG